MTFNAVDTVDTVDTASLPIDDLHVVAPRAAGLDVHKMCITAAVRLCEAGSGPARATVKEFSALPDGLRAMTDWLRAHGVTAAAMEGTGGVLEGSVRGARRRRHPPRAVPRPARQADPRQEDRCQRQPVAGPHLPVRSRPAELRAPAALPPRAAVDPLSSQARRRAQPEPQPRPQDARPRRPAARRHPVGPVRRQRTARPRGAGRRAPAARHPGRPDEPCPGQAGAARPGPGRDARPHRVGPVADADGRRRPRRRGPRRARHAHSGRIGRLSAPLRLLQTIPGIDIGSACTILAEIGPDLGAFREARHLGAWAGVAPENNTSAGKRRSGRARKGNPTLRAALAECAHGAARTKNSQFYEYHRTQASHIGYKRAILATAHKLLRVIHAVLRDNRPYTDPDIDYERLVVARNAPRWIRKLKQYGFLEELQAVRA